MVRDWDEIGTRLERDLQRLGRDRHEIDQKSQAEPATKAPMKSYRNYGYLCVFSSQGSVPTMDGELGMATRPGPSSHTYIYIYIQEIIGKLGISQIIDFYAIYAMFTGFY